VLDQQSIDRFHRQVALFKAKPATKMMHAPWRMLRSMAVRQMYNRRGKASPTVADTFWGGKMNVVLPELMSESIYRYQFLEEGLTAAFIRLIQPGNIVFDVGAHFGYFSLLACTLVGEKGHVHSFEPTPSTFAVLQSNLQSRSNVTLNNCAVYSSDTEMQFDDFGVQFSAYNSLVQSRLHESLRLQVKPTACKVSAITLDGYIARTGQSPDFIKIDAENVELSILQGMQQTLAGTRRPMISLEVGPDCIGEGQSTGTLSYLLKNNYVAYEYDQGSQRLREHKLKSEYVYDNLIMVPNEKTTDLMLS
jgi:FkbM family methyltransferase